MTRKSGSGSNGRAPLGGQVIPFPVPANVVALRRMLASHKRPADAERKLAVFCEIGDIVPPREVAANGAQSIRASGAPSSEGFRKFRTVAE